tara:strand:- start:1910 stop:2098 length:189 start_codon:yes stop_codon:yes gene_type:complete
MLGHFVVCADSILFPDRAVVGIVIESLGDKHKVCWNKGGTRWCCSDELFSLTERNKNVKNKS